MTDETIRDASPALSGTAHADAGGSRWRTRRGRWGSPKAWLGSWRAAVAAEAAYESAKARGQPRDAAVSEAFDALTRNEVADNPTDGWNEELARRLVDAGNGDQPRRMQGPTRELDGELAATAVPRDAECAHGDLRVAVLCLAIIAALIVLGFAASLGIRSPA